MSFSHVLEHVIETGIFKRIPRENAKAHGILAIGKMSGRTPVADHKALWAMCESPIETAMAAALCYAPWPCPVQIEPQFKIGRYRLDFLVSSESRRIDVECDGEAFHHHDITMAQYQADRARDQFVEGEGIEVIRFRGTQIWVDAIGCAGEVAALIAGDRRGGD